MAANLRLVSEAEPQEVPPEEALRTLADPELWAEFEPMAERFLALLPRYAGGLVDHQSMELFSAFLQANPTAHSLRVALEADLLERLRAGVCVATAELIRGGGRLVIRADLWDAWVIDFGAARGLEGGQIVAWEVEIRGGVVERGPRSVGRPSDRDLVFAALDRRKTCGEPTNVPGKKLRLLIAQEAGAQLGAPGWSDRAVRRHIAAWSSGKE